MPQQRYRYGLTIQQMNDGQRSNLPAYLKMAAAGIVPGSNPPQVGLNVTSIRPQIQLYALFPTSDPATWKLTLLDTIVNRITNAGFRCVFPIQNPPQWKRSLKVTSPYGHGTYQVGSPSDYAYFAALLAARYAGRIDYEATNEDFTFDAGWDKINHVFTSHDFLSGSLAGQVYAACYAAIHAIDPNALVGAGSENNLQDTNDEYSLVQWVIDFLTAVLLAGVAWPAWMNVHYYGLTVNRGFGGNIGLKKTITLFKAGIAAVTTEKLPIRVTETGINRNADGNPRHVQTTEQEQADYLDGVINYLAADPDGQIDGVDVYTTSDTDKFSLVNLFPDHYFQAFVAYQQKIALLSDWGRSVIAALSVRAGVAVKRVQTLGVRASLYGVGIVVNKAVLLRAALAVRQTSVLPTRFASRVQANALLSARVGLRVARSLSSAVRTRLRVQATSLMPVRTRLRVVATRFLPLRLGNAVQRSAALAVRTLLGGAGIPTTVALHVRHVLQASLVRTLAVRANIGLGLVLPLPVLARLRVLSGKSVAARTRLRVGAYVALALRAVVGGVQAAALLAVRIRLVAPFTRGLRVRVVLGIPGQIGAFAVSGRVVARSVSGEVTALGRIGAAPAIAASGQCSAWLEE